MKTAEIREAFLSYFESKKHQRVQSSSLIPSNDPTLMFTNAGMVQFKDCFLGSDRRSYTRATTSQKCVRAGGKHNDLENVGFTTRHNTFFEMLGNFSFGDYFKEQAITFAWEFITQNLKLPVERLRVSVYEKDDESAELWKKIAGLPADKIVRFGDADNFWSMGDTGPCGPCTEIFWDQGKEVDGDRWLEFWNNVFMQYDRSADGKLTPLPKPSVDTGMGLERMASIMQSVPSNYDIDLMSGLIEAARDHVSRKTGKKLIYNPEDRSLENSALRVIVDHLRATSFLIADGVLPANDGRGYVLRRILRRAVRFGKRLGMNEPFMAELFPALQSAMGGVYPELKSRGSVITEIFNQEEEKFLETLDRGLSLLDEAFAKSSSNKVLPPELAFKLNDTFGFPLDLTQLIARERGYTVNETEVQKLMGDAQERSRASWKGSGDSAMPASVKEWKNQKVLPRYSAYDSEGGESVVKALAASDKGVWLAIDPHPFYAEGGGQTGDRGKLKTAQGSFSVLDSIKPYEDGFAVFVDAPANTFKVGDKIRAEVDVERREAIRSNHTATHLLHAALRKVLGTHVQQAGSLVNEEKLRFDFSHPKALSESEITSIEDEVNRVIASNRPLSIENLSYKDAIAKGALAFFSEKYGDTVRVISIPEFSTELCGGLHVRSTAEIRYFKITSESAVAAGTRRIEAITKNNALHYLEAQEKKVLGLAQRLKIQPDQLEERVDKMLDTQKRLEQEIESLRKKLASGASSGAEVIEAQRGALKIKIHVLPEADVKFLRDRGDSLRQTDASSLHVLLSPQGVLVVADPEKNKDAHAGDFLKQLTQKLGGRGGGQARMAQGQFEGTDLAQLAQKIQAAI